MKSKPRRKVIAIHAETGERREFESTYIAAKELQVSTPSVTQAIERGWECQGWNMYDTADEIRRRIATLEANLKIVEGL